MARREFARYGEHPKFFMLPIFVVYWLACVPCVMYFRFVSGSIPSRVTNFD